MKYWLLTTEFPPHFGGGIGTYCSYWAKILFSTGNNITVFIPCNSTNHFKISLLNGIRIVRFSPYFFDTSSFLGYETMVSYSFSEIVRHFIELEGVPDWLEAQEYNGIAYYILQRKHLAEKGFEDLKVIITCHAPSFLYFEYNHVNTYKLPYFWIGEMEKFCLTAADICISPSQYLIECLRERMCLDRKIFVLHNPIELSECNAFDDLGSEVVFIAKLSPSKGILQTLESFTKLWQSGYTYKLKLIGDPNFFYHAKGCTMGKYIEQRYLNYIQKGLLIIAGSFHSERLGFELMSAQVILVPSTVDNFPYTVIENMSKGKIVLASKQGGHSEIIIDGINGFLFDHDVNCSLEQKILEVFCLDKNQIEVIRRNAINTVRDVCNPNNYYQNKVSILESFEYNHLKSNCFPFLQTKNNYSRRVSVDHVNGEIELLSIVIPYFNMGLYIDECIKSIKRSTYNPIEIIIVNDGSYDAFSIGKLGELEGVDNIRIITQVNKGLAETRNAGASIANGKYLAFLDADDTVQPDYYHRAIQILKKKVNIHFVGCWVKYFGSSNSIWPSILPDMPYLLFHNMINSSSLVYKKFSFLKAGENDKKFIYGMEDYDSVISMVKFGFKGVVIPEALFNYRIRKGSMARGFNKENSLYLYQLLSQKHQDVYNVFGSEISNLLNANGPGFRIDNPTLDFYQYEYSGKVNRYLHKAFLFIKHKPLLRKVAITFYSFIKK